LETKVAAEHRELEKLLAELLDAVGQIESKASVREIFARLREAVEAHFGQEDHLYYPAIWALRPEHKPALVEFIRAHQVFVTRLQEIDDLLAQDALDDSLRALGEFTETFADHERAEERLLGSLDREIEQSPS
jgi:hemerythrin